MTDTTTAARLGASELMRELGLLVDGPQMWGRPLAARRPGVFAVELPAPLAEPPIDTIAVRRWLERVPTLRIDGERPGVPELRDRLARFWLPDETILFVGRSTRSMGQRLAAIYATPLGDARPTGAAHWLKALSVVGTLRVWWAETDAHEEYEDALLAQIAARNAAERAPVLPFANMAVPDGTQRPHGLTDSLRADSASPANTAATAKASATRRRAATSGAPRKPRVRTLSSRAAPEPTHVSADGMKRLNEELGELRNVTRPQVIARVKAARELGDLKENADYEYARKEQSFVEGRIQTIEQMIRTAVVIEQRAQTDVVHLGSTVDIETEGELVTYSIVGSSEADPTGGRLSNVSPVGRALLGARAGDEVNVELPGGSVVYRVVAVR